MSPTATKAPPELVEILKALDSHRHRLWQQTYGKLATASKQEQALNEYFNTFPEGDAGTAAKHLRSFILTGGHRLSDTEFREVTEAVEAAWPKGAPRLEAILLDEGTLAATAYQEYSELRQYQVSPEEDEPFRNHPLFWVCRWLAARIGVERDELLDAAGRLNSGNGLSAITLTDQQGKTIQMRPGLHWLVDKFNAADRNGTTQRLWESLLEKYPAVCEEAGLIEIGSAQTNQVEEAPKGPTTPNKLKPSEEIAYGQYRKAVESNAELDGARDRDVYEWVRKHLIDDGESLPAFAAWDRQIRSARAYHDTRKNEPRSGRPLGKSIVRQDQI